MRFREFLEQSSKSGQAGSSPTSKSAITPPGPSGTGNIGGGNAKKTSNPPASNMSPGVKPLEGKPKGGPMSPASLDMTKPKIGPPFNWGDKSVAPQVSPFGSTGKYSQPSNKDWPDKSRKHTLG